MASQWPPGCPPSEVLTGSCLSADENIHGREGLKGRGGACTDPSKITLGEAARQGSEDVVAGSNFFFCIIILRQKGTECVPYVFTRSSGENNTVVGMTLQ